VLLDYHVSFCPDFLERIALGHGYLKPFYDAVLEMDFVQRFTADGWRHLPVPLHGLAARRMHAEGYKEFPGAIIGGGKL